MDGKVDKRHEHTVDTQDTERPNVCEELYFTTHLKNKSKMATSYCLSAITLETSRKIAPGIEEAMGGDHS